MNINMKDTIDRELECIVLSEEMKSRIRKKAVSRRRDGVLKWAVVFAAAVILGGTGAAAGGPGGGGSEKCVGSYSGRRFKVRADAGECGREQLHMDCGKRKRL